MASPANRPFGPTNDAVGATTPHPDATTPEFVGRDDAFARVAGALDEGPALVLIEGEAGIGKTRLLREALVSAADRTLLVAGCPPLPEPFPLGPVIDGIRGLRPDVTRLGLSPLGGALRSLFPDWADQLPAALESLDDPKETRHRAFSALTELVERLAVEILVVEDAHWADSATLEWLLTITASGGRDLPIVVTYRPADVPDGSLLPRLTSRSPAGLAQVRIDLQPLTLEQTRRLVGSMLGTEEVSDEFAAFLYERTDGVPLALEETVRLMRDRHDIIRRGGRWSRRVLDELDVPPTVRDSVLERVERLDPPARAVLEAAAVLAAPADERLLGAVAGHDAEAGQTGLSGALRSGLLQETDPGRFVFRHVLDAEAVGGAIPVSRRRHLHGRAAGALQRRDPEPVVRLARHFREANDVEQWSRYAEAAADMAMESGDDRTAVALLHELLTGAEHPPDRSARFARKLGEAGVSGTAALGDLGRAISVVLQDVLACDDVTDGVSGEIRLLLGGLLLQLGEFDAAYAQLETAVVELEHDPVSAVGAMIQLAWPRAQGWPASRHLAWLDRAATLLAQVRPGRRRTSLAVDRATALLMLGEQSGWKAASEIDTEVSTLFERQEIARGLMNVGHMAMLWGHYGMARERLQAAVEQMRSTGYQRMVNSARMSLAHLDYYTGAWNGLADMVAALADAEETDPLSRLEAQLISTLLDLAGGDRGVAAQRLRDLVAETQRRDLVAQQASPAAAFGQLRLSEGVVDEALHLTADGLATIIRKQLWLLATDIAPVRVEALIADGQVREAAALVDQFAAWLPGRNAPAPAAALATCRAIVVEDDGDRWEAGRLFAEAAAAWAGLPRPYDELLVRERQGRCLLAAGEQAAGLEVLTSTEARLSELGARWDADRVALLLRQHGVEVARTWRRGPQGYGDQLSPREVEVVELVARGMSNKQIAETLFISHRTVGQHLASTMRKLHVSSRTAAAVAATEAGLLSTEADTDT